MIRAVVCSVLVATLVGCGADPASDPPNPVPDPRNPVEGIIVAIEGEDLTLETDAGDRHVFQISDPSVPVEHLDEHRTERLPVRITWRREGERLLATTIADVEP